MTGATECQVAGATLEGVRIAFYSSCDYSSRLREYKEALALRASGAEVRFYGRGETPPPFLIDAGFRVELFDRRFRDPIRPIGNRLLSKMVSLTVRWPLRWWWERSAGWHEVDDAITKYDPHIVHAVDTPSLFGAHREARRSQAGLVYDSHEYWAGFITNPGVGFTRKWGEQVLHQERELIRSADLVLTTSPDMADRMVADYGPLPIEVLYNSPEMSPRAPRPAHAPLRFAYHGNIGPDRNVEGLLEALAIVGGDSTLDIYGGYIRDAESRVMETIVRHGLGERVRVHGPFDYRQLSDILGVYDVEVYTGLRLDGNMDVTLPNKLFDAMGSGLAVAMPDFISIKRIVDGEGIGITFDTTTPEAIAAGLRGLIDAPDAVTAMKARSAAVASKYGWAEQGKKVVAAYARMLDRPLDSVLGGSAGDEL